MTTLYAYKVKMTKKGAEISFDAQKMHELLTSLAGKSRAEANLLYSYDVDRQLLLVQTETPLAECDDLALLKSGNIGSWLDSLENGQTIRFRVNFIPRVHCGNQDKYYYKTTQDDCTAWLQKKLEANGFNLIAAREIEEKKSTVRHKEKKGGTASLTIRTYDVTGVVQNAEAFKSLWRNGLGCGKTYGSGLMLAIA